MCNRKTLLILGFLVILFSCKKEEISGIPEIEFVKMEPNPAFEYQDSVVITISYLDGDGDLGENESGVKNLFVKDSRNGVEYSFRIRQLSPSVNISIQGELDIVLKYISLNDIANSEETVSYEIFLIDRSGNQSNVITTPELTIKK